MIKNFEKETSPLNKYEKEELMPAVTAELSIRVGKDKIITNNEMIVYRLRPNKLFVTAPRLRKIINYLRTRDVITGLIATSQGYYVASTRKEMEDYDKSLKGREEAIHEVRVALRRQIDMMFPEGKKKKGEKTA